MILLNVIYLVIRELIIKLADTLMEYSKQCVVLIPQMLLGFFSTLVAVIIAFYAFQYIPIAEGLYMFLKMFGKDEFEVSANQLFTSTIIISFLAFHIYKFLSMLCASLFESFFGRSKIFNILVKLYDKKILITNLTLILVFMGFLPLVISDFVSIEIRSEFDKLIIAIILSLILPYSKLLIEEAKNK